MNLPALAAPFAFGEAEPLREALDEAGFREVEVIPVSHYITFPSISIFIQASITGSAAVIGELARLDTEAKTHLADQLMQDMTPILEPYLNNGSLIMPLTALVARGIA